MSKGHAHTNRGGQENDPDLCSRSLSLSCDSYGAISVAHRVVSIVRDVARRFASVAHRNSIDRVHHVVRHVIAVRPSSLPPSVVPCQARDPPPPRPHDNGREGRRAHAEGGRARMQDNMRTQAMRQHESPRQQSSDVLHCTEYLHHNGERGPVVKKSGGGRSPGPQRHKTDIRRADAHGAERRPHGQTYPAPASLRSRDARLDVNGTSVAPAAGRPRDHRDSPWDRARSIKQIPASHNAPSVYHTLSPNTPLGNGTIGDRCCATEYGDIGFETRRHPEVRDTAGREGADPLRGERRLRHRPQYNAYDDRNVSYTGVVGLLELRGGGSADQSSGASGTTSRPPPGAGMRAFMDDDREEVAARPANTRAPESCNESATQHRDQREDERRSTEALIQHWEDQCQRRAREAEMARLPPRVIYGTSRGRNIVVCTSCMADVEAAAWRANGCPRCNGGASADLDDPAVPTSPLATRQSGFTFDGGTQDGTSSDAVEAAEGDGLPAPPVTDVEGCGASHEQGDEPAMRCDWCKFVAHEYGETAWHICRCSTVYCMLCAQWPCHSCTAVAYGPPEQAAPSATADLQIEGEGHAHLVPPLPSRRTTRTSPAIARSSCGASSSIGAGSKGATW